MTWIKKNNDLSFNSFNFVAPDGASEEKNEVLFPFAEKLEPAYSSTLAVTIKQMDTFLQPAELTGNTTINLTIDAQVTAGAKLHLKLDADGTNRTVTLGTGFAAAAADITATASTVTFKSYIYDGVEFLPMN